MSHTTQTDLLNMQWQEKYDALEKERDELVEQLPRWIPCSERLPDADYGQYFVLTQRVDGSEPFASINFFNKGAWVECDGFEVVAWMPIPEVVK